MIIVTVRPDIKNVNRQDYIAAFNAVKPKVLKEDGCLEYCMNIDAGEEGGLFIFERWESRDALNAHIKTPHMLEYFEKTKDWAIGEPQLDIYEIHQM